MTHKTAKRGSRCLQRLVRRIYRDAYCCRLNDGSGYLVWPGKCQPRGSEKSAIGFGTTAQLAWKQAWELNSQQAQSMVRRCRTCHDWQPESEFSLVAKDCDRLRGECKRCVRLRAALSMNRRKGVAVCIFCDCALFDAPTTLGWIKKSYRKGICYRCIESLHSMKAAIQSAPIPDNDALPPPNIYSTAKCG